MAVINAVTSNDKLLRAVFSEEDTAAIIAEADPAKRQAMIQEKWVATPIPEIVERARAVMEEETNTLTEVRKALATMEAAPFFLMPIVKRDENGWLVRYRGQGSEAESVVRVANKEAAVSLAYDGYEENVRTEARAMVDTLEAFAGATDIFKVDLANELLLKDTGISEQQMTEAAIAEGIINGMTREEAQNITWAVHGQNRLEQVEGVRRVVSKLARGANVLDAVEEPIEGKFMAAIKQGRLTREQAIAWVKVAAGVMNAPELVTAAESSERGLIEAVSDVVLADVFGKRKDGSKAAQGAISAGIRAKIRRGGVGKAETQLGQILASFRHFFGQVFKRARQLVKARKDGRIGEDFDTFLDTLMETDASVIYEREAAQEAVTMAGEVDNAPFSLARAMPQTSAPVVQNEEEVEDEPGTLAPNGPVEDLPLEGEDIPWESSSFSLAPQHLPEVFVPFTKEIMDQILLETPTIAAIHIDRMKVGEFEGVPLQGGMFYPSIVENLKKGIVWAFNAANIARGVARQAALNGGYVKLVLMQEGNVVGNKTFGTIWFNLLEQSIAKKKISETTALKELNMVRELYATHEKSAISTGHTKPWKTIKEARETIIGMPQKKRGSTYFQKSKTKTVAEGEKIAYQSLLSKKQTAIGFPDAIDIVANIEEPSFKGVPTGAVVAIIKFDPLDENESVQTAEEAGVTEHLSYKYVLKGKPVARMMKHRVIDETFPEVAGKMLSQQYTNFPVEEAVGSSFSLAPRSLASVADTVLASRMKKPEFREAFYNVARQKMEKLRSDGEWKVSKFGVASRRTGTDTMAANTRTAANIENERKFRFRSRQRELLEAGMNDLSPNQMMALEKGTEKWEDRPRLAGIFENGKLLSKTAATKAGKYDPKVHGDYDSAPGWLPPSMFGKGESGTMPDVLAQRAFNANLIPDATPDALWEVIKAEMEQVTKGNEEARAAQQAVREIEQKAAKQAREESEAWAKEQKAKVPTPKERQMAALRTLDAILSAFPPEIRGRVGGFVKLASLGTDKAREAEIVKRLDLLDAVVEKEAKKFYRGKIEDTFEKAKPKKGKAGEKPKGKLGAQTQALVDLARAFSELDEAGVAAERAAITDRMTKETDPAKVADLFEREQLLDLFGDLDERTSAELEAAAAWLSETYDTGRNRWRAVIEQREEQTRAQRAQAREEIGLQGLDAEQQKALEEARTITKRAAGVALSWLSFEQVMTSILGRGSKLARDVVRQARAATTRKTDALRAKRAAFKATMSGIFGTTKQREWQDKLWNLSQIGGVQVVKMEGARTETRTVAVEAVQRIIEGKAEAKAFGLDALKLDKLADAWAENDSLPANRRKENLSFEVPIAGTATPTRLSQLQAVNITMLARQPGYTENMAGHGWTAEVLEEIEAQLTPEAKAIRDWLAGEYRNGYDSLNEVYARMYGVNLPRLVNYSPGTFEAMDMMGQDIDPYGQGLLSEGGFRAGMLKTRGNHKAAPRLEDALSVYWSHVNATEHFKAFGEFARDLRGVMNNAEVRKSIKAKGGKDLLEAGQNWIGAFERNGVENRSTSSAFDEFIRRRQASQAYLALDYNMGTLMKQSTAALGSLLNMGPGAAARQFAKLVSGGLDLKAAYNSDVIQRRMDAGYSPEVRQAMAAMMAERPSWASPALQKGMEWIGNVDAVFTTVSYAMAYDYHLQSAKDAGMNDALAQTEAEREAEATVARTAQPSEMMDRSLFEMGLQPTGKFLFMFASEARQKAAIALEAYSPSSGLSKGERATRLLLLHVVFPLAIQTISNLWRDARDDDDDELFDSDNWRAGDYAKAMLLGPLIGIPLVGGALNAALTPLFGGHYFPNDPTQPLNRALGGGADVLEAIQEGDLESGLKGARSLMWALALAMGGEKAAAVGVGTNILYDAFRVTENLVE
jgi:hypothetical protein